MNSAPLAKRDDSDSDHILFSNHLLLSFLCVCSERWDRGQRESGINGEFLFFLLE